MSITKNKRFLLIPLLIAVIALVAVFWPSTEASAPKEVTSTVYEEKPVETPPTVEELLTLVNAERAKVGVKPLTIDPGLNQSAQMKSDELLREGWDDTPHVSDSGKRGISYIQDLGVRCDPASENVSYADKGLNTSRSAIVGWLNSPLHKVAMLDSKYETTGFGISGVYITEHFCDYE